MNATMRHLPRLSIPVALLWAFACSRGPEQRPIQAASARPAASQTTVAVVSPKLESVSQEVLLTGEFRPYQAVDLHAKVAGYLRQIHVDVGSIVKAGDPIAVLEVPEMDAELAHAAAERGRTEAELTRARAEIERAEANLKLHTVSHNRLSAAAKAEPGLIAQQEIDEALARRAAAAAQLASAKAALGVDEQRVVSARAVEQRTRTMAAYTAITAPFSGVVTRRFADPGAMIQAGTASQSQAMPVVRLADISRLRLAVIVPESAVPLVAPGQPVQIRVSALNRSFAGAVSRINRDVATASRTMEAEIDVANSGGALTPGMYAEVAMNVEKRTQAITVPVVAVSNSGGNRTVWIVDSAGVVQERTIKTGMETAASMEVLSGLSPDDRIIVSNRSLLRPGQIVNAQPAGEN